MSESNKFAYCNFFDENIWSVLKLEFFLKSHYKMLAYKYTIIVKLYHFT